MTATELHEVNERIGKLERRLRWQNRALITCGLGAVVVSLLFGQAPAKRIVEAEEFILRGPQGQELASLDSEATGAFLMLFDSKHRARIVLQSSDGESGVGVLGTDPKAGVGIEVNDNNKPVVSLLDEQGRTRAELAIMDNGPAIRMRDSSSNVRAAMSVSKDVPIITVYSGPDPGKGSVIVTAGVKEGGAVLITGSDGKARNVER
jgi:hypothetical protein